MRSLRSLVLVGLMALAAMAFAAPTAFAAIEVKTEPNPGTHCGPVEITGHKVSGGCGLHVVSTEEVHLTVHDVVHSMEQTLSVCAVEFEARIDEAGEGQIYNPVLTGALCPVEPCEESIIEATGEPSAPHSWTLLWPFHIKDAGDVERLEVSFCVQPAMGEVKGNFCTIHMPIMRLGHTITFNAEPEVGCEGLDEREVKGRWTLESEGEATHNTIEIINT